MGTEQPKVTDAPAGGPDDQTPKTGDEAHLSGGDGPVDAGEESDEAELAERRSLADGAERAEKDPEATPDGETGSEGESDSSSERWAAFGPEPEVEPGRLRRGARAVGRVLIHEWTLASVAALALAVLMTWPTLRYAAYAIPQDTLDPALQAWQMAWSGQILLTDPGQLWHANTFYPLPWSFAFSDTLLGYAPAGMIGDGPTAAVVRYNIMFVLAHALATLGAYALVRQLGAGRVGAAVAGVSYAYAPWLLSQAGHLHVLSNGGIPLALAMLARGHGWSLRHGYRPERRHAGWVLAGWLVAAWQISLGFGIGLPFAYVLALITLVIPVAYWIRRWWFWPEKRPFGGRLLLADLAGGAFFAAVGAVLAIPYFKVAELHPYAKRSVAELDFYSPPLSGFFTAPPESLIWGDVHAPVREGLSWAPEMTLLPGFVLYGLAVAGLLFSIWTVRQRLLLLAGVLVTGVLAMGTRFFGGTYTYLPLLEHLPGWEGLRTPGRLMLWTTLLLGVLAAGSVSAFAGRAWELAGQRIPPWPGPWLRLAMLLPLALVLVEGLNVTPHPRVPEQPAVLRADTGPVLVLPSGGRQSATDQHAMLWSTSRFQPLVNGVSGFVPRELAEVRETVATFPDQASVDYLRGLGVETVVVLRDRLAGTPWEHTIDEPVYGLDIEREEDGDIIVFRL
ncbi:MAG TPA: hypothetical protein VFX60_16035 [Micromonospora sp.]|nr:hypothetical protein [Micromonospora sp.]